MTPRYWIEFRGAKKIAIFVATILLAGLFWWSLPDSVNVPLGRHRWTIRPPVAMTALWVGGWFVLLFVRAEDLDLTSKFDYQSLSRLIAGFMVAIALVIAVFLSLEFME